MKSKSKEKEVKDCPHCGCCPHCGRKNIEVQTWYPYPHVYPWVDSGTAWTDSDTYQVTGITYC